MVRIEKREAEPLERVSNWYNIPFKQKAKRNLRTLNVNLFEVLWKRKRRNERKKKKSLNKFGVIYEYFILTYFYIITIQYPCAIC